MIAAVEDRREQVAALCQRHGVERLDLFGSASGAGEGFDPEGSDLDFVVSFERRDPPGLSSTGTSASRRTSRASSAAGWTSLRRTPCSRTRSLPRASRGRGCRSMRPERTPRTLRQIADACSFVLSVTEGKTLDDYSGERLLRQGVERNLQIIGEAVGRLRRDDPETADRLSEHERIVGFRNVLVHGYDLVDDGIVWDTIRTKLPLLLSEVETLLEERQS